MPTGLHSCAGAARCRPYLLRYYSRLQALISCTSTVQTLSPAVLQPLAGFNLLHWYDPVQALSPAVLQPLAGFNLLHWYSPVQTLSPAVLQPLAGFNLLHWYGPVQALSPAVLQPLAGFNLLHWYSPVQTFVYSIKVPYKPFILHCCPSMSSYSLFFPSSKNPQALFDTVFPPRAGIWKSLTLYWSAPNVVCRCASNTTHQI